MAREKNDEWGRWLTFGLSIDMFLRHPHLLGQRIQLPPRPRRLPSPSTQLLSIRRRDGSYFRSGHLGMVGGR